MDLNEIKLLAEQLKEANALTPERLAKAAGYDYQFLSAFVGRCEAFINEGYAYYEDILAVTRRAMVQSLDRS